MSPTSERSLCSSNTWATKPWSRIAMIPRPSGAVAIPADSWPRCWSANSAKYATLATSCPGAKMPKTPHSSRGPSRWSFTVGAMPSLLPRLAAALDPFPQPALACIAQLGNWDVEQSLDRQGVAADLADHDEPGECVTRSGHDEPPARRLAERIEALRQVHCRAQTAGDHALGERDRDPAFGDVVRAPERARAHPRPDGPVRDPDSPDVGARKLAHRWKAAQLRQRRPYGRRLERPDQGDRVALALEPEPSGPGSPR